MCRGRRTRHNKQVQMRPLSEPIDFALERRPSSRRCIKVKEFFNSDVPRLRNRHFNFGHLPERSGKRTCLRNLQKTPQNERILTVETCTLVFHRTENTFTQRKLGVKNAVWPKMAENGPWAISGLSTLGFLCIIRSSVL